MSGSSSGRLTRQMTKQKTLNTTIDATEITSAKKPRFSISNPNKQPEPSTFSSASVLPKTSTLDTSLNYNPNSGTYNPLGYIDPSLNDPLHKAYTAKYASDNSSSPEKPGTISEQNIMEVDSTSNSSSSKGKEKENSIASTIRNFTRRLNFTLITDFSTISKELSRSDRMNLINLRCSRFSSYSNNRVGNYRGYQYHFVYLSDDEDVQILINHETSEHETNPYLIIKFKKFDQLTIDQSIKASRSSEADRTIKATNFPPEINKQTLQEIFTKYETIECIG